MTRALASGSSAEIPEGTAASGADDGHAHGSSRKWLVAFVAGISLVGLLLRVPSFNDSLFADEISTYYIVTGHSVSHIVYLLQGHSIDLNPPLPFLLDWVVERFGTSAQTLRLVSLLAGTSAIPLTYLLGLWTVGRKVGVVGATLVALSPFLIFYSTEARSYALALLLVLLSMLALLRALDTGSTRWWVLYAVFSCAATYTHYIAVFYLGTLFAWAAVFQPDARRHLIAANVAAAICYVPWLPTVLKDTRSPGNSVISFLEPFNAHLVVSYLARWSIGHPLLGVLILPGVAVIALITTGLVAASVGLVRNLRGRSRAAIRRPTSSRTVLLVVLALAPPAEIALYSSIGNSVWEARNLIAGWPSLALALGALLTKARGPFRVAAVALVTLGYAIGSAQMLMPVNHRPDYDSVVSFIDRVGSTGDPVIDIPAPTPGPLTNLDGAFGRGGSASAAHPILRLGYPPLAPLLRSRPYAPVPQVPSGTVIAQAAALARGRTLFVVAPRQYVPLLDVLLKSLPARFRRVDVATFTGLIPLVVYVFRDSTR